MSSLNATTASSDACLPIASCKAELPDKIVIPFGGKSDKYLYEYKEKVFTDDLGSASDNQVVWIWLLIGWVTRVTFAVCRLCLILKYFSTFFFHQLFSLLVMI
jgi:hypothetical protein